VYMSLEWPSAYSCGLRHLPVGAFVQRQFPVAISDSAGVLTGEGRRKESLRVNTRTRLLGGFLCCVLAAAVLPWCGCNKSEKKKQKELLIYCSTTTNKPISEIAGIIEKQEDCKIIIINDGTGNLLKMIRANNVGDLYLPSTDSYIKTCLTEGIVTETVHVGYNEAAIMVQKGNPLDIKADLSNLTNSKYYVVLGNPASSGIGKETAMIFDKAGIKAEAMANAHKFANDSKDLAVVLKKKETDLVVNWYAVSTWPENAPYVTALPIDEKYASRKKLVLGLLGTSKYPDIARRFMEYAASDKGRAIFAKYGFYDVK